MVVNRMIKFLKTINKNENILLSTHGGILRSFCIVHGITDKPIKNCEGIKFELDENNLPKNISYF